MNDIIELQLWQMAAAYVFVVILIVIVKIKGIKRETEILLATIRMTLQLIIVAYLLSYMFDINNPWFTVVFLISMLIFSVHNVFKRVKTELLYHTKIVVAVSLVSGTLLSILYFNFVVIQFSPWYDPRYFIPIAGMIIGNSMTGISLGVARLTDGFYEQRAVVESSLMLGATPKEASKTIVNSAFDAAILPTINSMVGMGIVFLPGMMTGQILSGISPIVAVEYQIAIMLGIVGSVALSVIMFVQLGYKTFFNSRNQLKI
ncbi:ABC transporter permease [Desulfuribacillus alkaliarsenatis]|uniref:Iron export ABC transporter permease subunit FetB n=1 Tax=Desulfuribacillus alkaliarsenatis TaxID=766136 RepID=A0A1E5G4G7_9FIRM|nr:iron export ABC transporter permease subunit FetB [Desulfuribacillus alkaliarsenatis]OEF97978.1 iron export ABC transporter permease subunit FetB [Desulfuribacillus alkaliarsenatis]